jgi:nucleotide-binding universal stress UspA family protein
MYGPLISQFSGIIETWDRARKSAEENLIEWENRLWSWGIKVSSKLAIGDPVQETIKEAELFNADFIAVGTRGISGIRGFLIGSFAKSLLHSSPIPVITLRFPHIKVEKVLVALDLFLPKITNWGKIHFHLDPKEKAIYEEQVLKEMPDFNGAEKVVEVSFSPNLDYAGAIVIGSVAEGVISRSDIPLLTINIAHPRI